MALVIDPKNYFKQPYFDDAVNPFFGGAFFKSDFFKQKFFGVYDDGKAPVENYENDT